MAKKCSISKQDVGAMTRNMQMEQFCLAYIRAVAAQAGYQVARPELDTDSVDGILMAGFGSRPQVHFQAKATSRDIVRDSVLHFPLPVKNYDDLRADVINPRMLIVLLMPEESGEWLEQTEDALCLRRCAYWLSLEGCPTVTNTRSVTVHVPVSNTFNSDQLRELMNRADEGIPLC